MSGNRKILIVEDEGILAITVEEWLKRLGYVVLDVVSSAEAAIKAAEKFDPDLILMDIILEGEMDGVSAVEAIHQRKHIPVIYLTACHDTETVQRANMTRHSGFMQKPVRKGDLEITVESVLRQQ